MTIDTTSNQTLPQARFERTAYAAPTVSLLMLPQTEAGTGLQNDGKTLASTSNPVT